MKLGGVITGEHVEYPTTVPWKGVVLGGYVRNSTWLQRDNPRTEFQRVDMGEYAKQLGYAVRWFDEGTVSGSRMNNRATMQTLLGLIAAGEVHGIFCADISRLSRDERLLDPLVIGHTLRQYAEGRLLTNGQELDLRRSDHWQVYTRLASSASSERTAILSAAAQGVGVAVRDVVRGKRPMFRKGKVMIGYRRVPVIDEFGRARHNPNRRLVTTLERNMADEPVLNALAEEFDRQPTLVAVLGALRRRGIVGPAHATDGYTWTSRLLREILQDRLYEGVWTGSKTQIPAHVLLQPDAGRGSTVAHPVPHLAWWDRARLISWRTKFLPSNGDTKVRRRSAVPHSLLGLAFCGGCNAQLGAAGATDDGYARRVLYRCPNRKHGCPQRTLVTEESMLRALARQLTNILRLIWNSVSAVPATRAPRSDADIEARLVAVSQREEFIRDNWLRRMHRPPDWIIAEVEELAAIRCQLSQRQNEIRAWRDVEIQADELLELLRSGCSVEISSKSPECQAAVWRLLISSAHFYVGGTSGKGRTITVDVTLFGEWRGDMGMNR